MTSRPGWDSQFAEDEAERAERWRRTKAKRIADGSAGNACSRSSNAGARTFDAETGAEAT